MFRYFAHTYMAVRECIAPNSNRRREAQEEILADLNHCLEQVQARIAEMESRIERCTEQAVAQGRIANDKGVNITVRTRAQLRAKMFMHDRRRLQSEHDKAMRITHLLQTQIDSVLSSHVDTLIVQTMRSYNHTAMRLGAPALTSQIENLSDQLSDRSHELGNLQEALAGITTSMQPLLSGGGESLDEEDSGDARLMAELEAMLRSDDDVVLAEPRGHRHHEDDDEEERRNATTNNQHHNNSNVSPSQEAVLVVVVEEEQAAPLLLPTTT